MTTPVLPWMAAVDRPTVASDGTLVLSGWLVGPGDRPVPEVTVAGNPVAVDVRPRDEAVSGLPDDWPAWTWKVRAHPGDADQVELVMTAPGGGDLVRREVSARSGADVPVALGDIDGPAPGAVVKGDLVLVTGWLLLDGDLANRIEVEVDGGAPVLARVALPRPDLQIPGVPMCGLAGYEARVPIELAPGETRRIRVRVRAWSREGKQWLAPVRECTVRMRRLDPAEERSVEHAKEITRRMLANVRAEPDPRHVFVYTHSLRVGGGELWLHELLSRLIREQGMRVTVAVPAEGPLRSELEELGAEVWITGQHVIQEAVTYQSHVAELALLMRASGAASVLVNTLGMFVGVDAALQAELPVAWVIHESFALPDFAYLNWGPDGISPVVRKAWQRCIAEASALLFVADATRELFLQHAKPRRCLTVRYGIDLRLTGFGAAADPKAALGLPSDSTVLLTVGVSEPRKGHGTLIASFELVRRRFPNAHLVIVGMHDSPYANALQDWARDDDHVTLVPLVRDPLPWFRAADLFVNSSDIESLPRTILEAMALDLPVIAADVFGARELVVDGESGWLVAPNDLNALTVGMLRALGTPAEQRARMAQRAKDHVAPFLDARGYGAEYAAILGKLAQSIGDRG